MIDISKAQGVVKYIRKEEKKQKPLTIFLNQTRLRICINTARNLKWDETTKVALFKLGEDWYISKTNEEDGYKISNHGRGGYSFTASIVCRQIYTKMVKPDCLLIKTNFEYHTNVVYKITRRINL